MRIAYICADAGVPIFGTKGCSIHVRSVIETLLQQGHQVELFTNRLGGEPFPHFAAVPIHLLPPLPRTDLAQREANALAQNEQLRSLLEQQQPFDLVYERYSLWSFAGIEYAHHHHIPSVLEVNAPLIDEQIKHRGLINVSQAHQVAQQVFTQAQVVVAVSQAVADYLISYTKGEGNIQMIANGVDVHRFSPQMTKTTNDAEFVIGFVGTMKPWHDLPTLIDAFALCYQQDPLCRLLLVGDGTIKAQIEAQVQQLPCANAVHFTGAVTATQIPSLLASVHVAIAPYPHLSNTYFSPLKVYEYMAAGLPVIASEVGQLKDLIHHHVNGLLCPLENPTALAEQILYLRSHPDIAQQLGQTARQQVEKYHTWEVVVQKILDLV